MAIMRAVEVPHDVYDQLVARISGATDAVVFKDALQGLEVGQGGYLIREAEDADLSSIKRRFTMASHEIGFSLKYHSVKEKGRIAFRIKGRIAPK